MSVFTNPASGAPEQAEAYVSALLGLLEGTDPLEVLGGTGEWLERRTAGLALERIRRPEAPGKWSVAQILRHLADSEIIWGWRLRMALAEDRPPLTGYDQDLWADRLGYEDADPDRSRRTFRILRDEHLWLLRRASPEDLERVAVHVERGEESVRHMISLYAGHDLLHRNQIDRVLGAVGPT